MSKLRKKSLLCNFAVIRPRLRAVPVVARRGAKIDMVAVLNVPLGDQSKAELPPPMVQIWDNR